MSDLVPATPFDGIVRVVKLINGDELLGIVRDVDQYNISIILPAKLETAYSKDKDNNIIEYIKLTNYAANVKNHEMTILRSAILYIAAPIDDLEKMYQTFFHTMKTNPSSILNGSADEIQVGPEAGLQMLNELFNNEDFVDFVNNMIESFEGESLFTETSDDLGEEAGEETNLFPPESSINDSQEEEAPKAPKRKKRKGINPETNNMPFNPDASPNSAESWSDDPRDYL